MYGGIVEAPNAHGVATLTEDFTNQLLSPAPRSERPEVVQRFQNLPSKASVESMRTAFKVAANRLEPGSLGSEGNVRSTQRRYCEPGRIEMWKLR